MDIRALKNTASQRLETTRDEKKIVMIYAAIALSLFTDISNILIVVMGAAAGLIWGEVRERRAVS